MNRISSPPRIWSTLLGRSQRASSFDYRGERQRIGGYFQPPRPVKRIYTLTGQDGHVLMIVSGHHDP